MNNPDPLIEWSRLQNENTKHELVSAMYLGLLSRSEEVDKFALWLLAAAGATSVLLISNIKVATESLSVDGFRVALFFLILSGVAGILERSVSAFLPTSSTTLSRMRESVNEVFSKHGVEREKIVESAEMSNEEIPSDIDMNQVYIELARPFPFWVKWSMLRSAKRNEGERQGDLHVAIRAYILQSNLCLFQAISYVFFLCSVAFYVQTI